MARKNKIYAARIGDPDFCAIIEKFKTKNGLSDSDLVRHALGNLVGREKGPVIPEPVKKWIKKIADGMGRNA